MKEFEVLFQSKVEFFLFVVTSPIKSTEKGEKKIRVEERNHFSFCK